MTHFHMFLCYSQGNNSSLDSQQIQSGTNCNSGSIAPIIYVFSYMIFISAIFDIKSKNANVDIINVGKREIMLFLLLCFLYSISYNILFNVFLSILHNSSLTWYIYLNSLSVSISFFKD